jgi:hypothetical protein
LAVKDIAMAGLYPVRPSICGYPRRSYGDPPGTRTLNPLIKGSSKRCPPRSIHVYFVCNSRLFHPVLSADIRRHPPVWLSIGLSKQQKLSPFILRNKGVLHIS